MNNEIKIAFFDVDWTLYDHQNHRWSFKSIEAIKELKKKGVKVVLCTARSYESMKLFGLFDLGIDWDGFISSAGACAYADGEFLRKTLIDAKEVKRFLALVKERNLTCEIVMPTSRILAFPQTKESEAYYQIFIEKIPPVEEYKGEEVTGLNLFAAESEDAIFQKEFPTFCFFRYAPVACDISGEPHRKGDGINVILEHFNLKEDDAIAFGDDIQDITMAEQVKTFVCMNNGKDEVKKVASFVTKDVWDDGVYYALLHYGLI